AQGREGRAAAPARTGGATGRRRRGALAALRQPVQRRVDRHRFEGLGGGAARVRGSHTQFPRHHRVSPQGRRGDLAQKAAQTRPGQPGTLPEEDSKMSSILDRYRGHKLLAEVAEGALYSAPDQSDGGELLITVARKTDPARELRQDVIKMLDRL